MTNAQIFRAAAQRIERNGWLQGDWGSPDGPACISGSVRFVLGYGKEGRMAEEHISIGNLLTERLSCCSGQCPERPCGRHQWAGLGRWNDARERTKEEVLAVLEALAFDEDLKAAATPAASSQEAILPTLKEAVPVG